MLVNTLNSGAAKVVLDSAKPQPLIDFVRKQSLDAVFLDLHLGKGPTGLDLAVAVRRYLPKVGIVVVTSYEEPRLLQSNPPQLPRGTVYLVKNEITNIQDLSDALERSVLLASSEKEKGDSGRRISNIGRLTDGQVELLRMMALGLSNAEIAKRKFVTEKSVELSVSRLVRALGIERDPTQNQRVHISKVYFRATGLKLSDET
jgi:DNA-binding NarL/FixJ family response regulator